VLNLQLNHLGGGGGAECPTQHTASLTRPGSLPARPGRTGQYITEKQARHGGQVRWKEIGLRRREGENGAGMATLERRIPNRTGRVNFCKTGRERQRVRDANRSVQRQNCGEKDTLFASDFESRS
jgi:hypothetical protein